MTMRKRAVIVRGKATAILARESVDRSLLSGERIFPEIPEKPSM
jgi:hypothetical protein